MNSVSSQEPKKKQVHKMFNAIAPSYDRLNHLLSFNIDKIWRKKLVTQVAKIAPKSILDIATGTGDLAIALREKMPQATIVGVDLSEGMLKIAEEKVQALKMKNAIRFTLGDAEELPFQTEEFELATVAFGVRNFQDLRGGLLEAHRVLKAGGHFFVLEFSTPRNKIFRAFYLFYFHRILPFIGKIISKDKQAYSYLPGSVKEFPSRTRFLNLMEKSGFIQCSSTSLCNGIAYIYTGLKPLDV